MSQNALSIVVTLNLKKRIERLVNGKDNCESYMERISKRGLKGLARCAFHWYRVWMNLKKRIESRRGKGVHRQVPKELRISKRGLKGGCSWAWPCHRSAGISKRGLKDTYSHRTPAQAILRTESQKEDWKGAPCAGRHEPQLLNLKKRIERLYKWF